MRILAVRGENLASLPRFAFDLESDPLAGAGLFAITGETGAGKSTLLDALCLALYGDYPRASIARRETAPDPSGDAITAKDARNILRRGAASGFAEVDFVGNDGVRYRARWESRRARNSAVGKLQKADRRLDRLDKGEVAESVATGVSDVLEAVHQRTGLTFDQFRRTALLAQGEFDAFLLSDENERAELLEMITGTEIYGRLSRATHAATAERRTAIALRQATLDAVARLTVAERAGLEDQEAKSAAAQRQLTSERVGLVAVIERELNRRKAATLLAEADRALQSALAADASVAADRTRLALLERLTPVAAKAEALRAAERAMTEASARQVDGEAAAAKAALSLASAHQALKAAVLADGAAKKIQDDFEPLWREADQLETNHAEAEREFALALEANEAAQIAEQQAVSKVTAYVSETASLQSERGEIVREIDANARHAILAQRSDEITQQIARFADLSNTASACTRQIVDAEAPLPRIAEQAAAASDALVATTTQRNAIVARFEAQRSQVSAQDVTDAETAHRALGEISRNLRDAADTARHWRDADAKMVAARQTAALACATIEAAEQRHAQGEQERGKLEAARQELLHLQDLADATASQVAQTMRTALTDGEPCPVCGSTQHPYHAGDAGGADALVNEVRRRRGELDARLRETQQILSEARGEAAEARGRAADATRIEAVAGEEKLRLATHYAAIARPLHIALAPVALVHQLPAEVGDASAQALDPIAAAVHATLDARAAELSRLHVVRNEIETMRNEADRLLRQQDDAKRQVDLLAREQQAAEQALASAKARLRETEAVRETVMRGLEAALGAAGLTRADLERDADASAAAIAQLASAFADLSLRRQQIDARLQVLGIESASATSAARSASGVRADAETMLERRRTAAGTTKALLDRLFAGVDHHQHRQAALADRSAKATARVTANDAHQAQAMAHAAAAERAASAREAARQVETTLDTARQALSSALSELGIAETDALALLSLRQVEVGEIRARVSSVTTALVEATQLEATRRADLTALTANGAHETDAAAAEQRLPDVDKVIAAAHESAADARARLALDDQSRERTATLHAEICEAKAELDLWQDVDAAIGSVNGDKFRRFAQGITLDHLVRLANLHLEAVHPRYRLLRSRSGDLALHVLDRDMGDEERSVRSLSGGERFVVSLALALALAGLEGRQSFVDTLFIDEGFGSLDADTLDMAIGALEALQSQGRKVGVITHVAAMIERITVQIRVEKRGHGRSIVRILPDDGARDRAA